MSPLALDFFKQRHLVDVGGTHALASRRSETKRSTHSLFIAYFLNEEILRIPTCSLQPPVTRVYGR